MENEGSIDAYLDERILLFYRIPPTSMRLSFCSSVDREMLLLSMLPVDACNLQFQQKILSKTRDRWDERRDKRKICADLSKNNRDKPLLISIAFFPRLDTTNQTMDTFESSSTSASSANNHIHRNTWSNYPAECYSTSADYYRPYGTARKHQRWVYHRSKPLLSLNV